MKKQSLRLLLIGCMAATATARAATISGVVTFSGAGATMGAPAPNIKMVLTDTTGTYHYLDTTRTSSSGAYSFTLPAAIVAGHHLTITPADPLTTYPPEVSYVEYPGNSFEVDFQTYRGPITGNQIIGYTVSSGTVPNSRFLRFYVIRKAYDPVAADTVLTATDSFATAGSGSFIRHYSSAPSMPAGTSYLLKGVTQAADARYSNDLPTYFDSVLQWSSATAITNFMGGVGAITFRAGVNPGGPGFIGGSVLLGANKGTGTGDPLAKRIILLTDATSGKAVGYTYSDAAGHFQFSNIPYGTYKLFGDVWGKSNPALTVTLSASSGMVNNVLFRENRKDFTGQIGGLGVNSANPLLAGISAYPNPAKDYLELGGLAAISGGKTITLSAMNGAVITTRAVAPGQAARIAVTTLASGIYMLRVETTEGSVQLKIVK